MNNLQCNTNACFIFHKFTLHIIATLKHYVTITFLYTYIILLLYNFTTTISKAFRRQCPLTTHLPLQNPKFIYKNVRDALAFKRVNIFPGLFYAGHKKLCAQVGNFFGNDFSHKIAHLELLVYIHLYVILAADINEKSNNIRLND